MGGRFVRIGWGEDPKSNRHACDLPHLVEWAGRLRFDRHATGSVWECECGKQWQIGTNFNGDRVWQRRRFRIKPTMAEADQ